jgi:hypothetical protein
MNEAKPLPNRIGDVLAKLMLLSSAQTQQLSANRVREDRSDDAGSSSKAPPGAFARQADRSEYERWQSRFENMCEAAERACKVAQVGLAKGNPLVTISDNDRSSPQFKEANARITSQLYAGLSPTHVAFIEGRTTHGVQQLRGKVGLEPETGVPVSRADIDTSRTEPNEGDALQAATHAAMRENETRRSQENATRTTMARNIERAAQIQAERNAERAATHTNVEPGGEK